MASFTFPGAALPEFLNVSVWTIMLYFTNTAALSFVFTFVYLKTNGSVFYAIILHAMFNAASNIALDFLGKTDHLPLLISSYVINILLAALFGFLLVRNKKITTSQLIIEIW